MANAHCSPPALGASQAVRSQLETAQIPFAAESLRRNSDSASLTPPTYRQPKAVTEEIRQQQHQRHRGSAHSGLDRGVQDRKARSEIRLIALQCPASKAQSRAWLPAPENRMRIGTPPQ